MSEAIGYGKPLCALIYWKKWNVSEYAGSAYGCLSLRYIQILNASKGPDWGLFSFCFKGRWQGHPTFGDWALDPEWVSEWPASLFERPSTVTGRRKTSWKLQWVAAFMGSSCSRDNPVTETDTKAQGGQKDGSEAAAHQVSAAVREIGATTENPAGSL